MTSRENEEREKEQGMRELLVVLAVIRLAGQFSDCDREE